ncbi:MAG: GNAT family N-acetyltransferase [Lachnospiraceae bacterium]|nr:GNAT family N-acetyltransferase [Lachnospiraceae bacterium]
MKLQFVPVETAKQISQLAGIANTVWHEYFPCILDNAQIDYMVEKFQSEGALTSQIQKEGYEYFFLELNGIYIGYMGVHEEKEKLFLSKLYLLKPYRGKGYASQAFEFLEGLAQAYGLKAIYLTVNRNNAHSIAVYEKRGFETVKEQAVDIGEGFVMDDFVMEYQL